MGGNEVDGMTHVTHAEWDALLEHCTRILAETAQVRGDARQARSEAVEQRLRSKDGQFERDKAAVGQYH